MSEQERLLAAPILKHLQDLLDGFDQWLGTALPGSEDIGSISLSVADVVEEDGYYRFIGTFTDTGPTEGTLGRLGATLSTLTISEHANVKRGKFK